MNLDASRSSARPWARRAMRLAVAGATTTTSASLAKRTWSTSPGRSQSDVCTGLPVSAANVSLPTKRVADSVITTVTSARAPESSLARNAALYAAMPPDTPSNTPRLWRTEGLLVFEFLASLVVDLPLCDLFESDRQRLVRQTAALDQGRDELRATLAELAGIGVYLSRALGGQDHERVLRVDGGHQVVGLWVDHQEHPPGGLEREA